MLSGSRAQGAWIFLKCASFTVRRQSSRSTSTSGSALRFEETQTPASDRLRYPSPRSCALTRLKILLAASCCALILVSHAELCAQSATAPNILLVFTDDMGYGDLGCYGSKQIPTPNIDALAASGVLCTQAYVTAPVCAPSRAGLMSGCYPQRFGFEHNLNYRSDVDEATIGIPNERPTMARRLGELGYRNGLVGKWHLGRHPSQHPLERGFDSFFGMIKGHHGYFPKPEKNALFDGREPLKTIDSPYLTDLLTDRAIEFMDRGGEKPWFLFLSYNTPHTPMHAREDDLERFAEVKPRRRRIYCAMQHRLDQSVGRLVRALEESGQRENTLIVFLNDNGGSTDVSSALNAPLRGQKSTFLEGGIRVPCIFNWPAGLPAHGRFESPVMAFDLYSTFAAAAGAEEPSKDLDGVNLLPALRGEEILAKRDLYWRMTLRGAALREADFKLVRVPHRPAMLFDVVRDPSETRDLASEKPEEVRRLLAKLHAWECEVENPRWISAPRWAAYNRKLYERPYKLEQPR